MKNVLLCLCVLSFISTLTIAQDYKDFDAGVAKFREKDYDAVIEMFSAILAKPDHNKRFDEDLYFYRGQSYYHKNEFGKSLDDLSQALTLDHYNKGVIYWYQARCYDKQGKKSEAGSSYDQAVTASEKNKKVSAQILADRADFHARNGNKAAADQDIALAKSLDPSLKIGAAAVATPASRTPTEGTKTQVIVKSNPSTNKESGQVNTQPAAQQSATPPK